MELVPLAPIVVIGGSLAGMAAAARLAKAFGSSSRRAASAVVLLESTDRLGGRYAGYRYPDASEALVDDLPGMINFPAPWRDLFRKSGRVFETELARSRLALVPAPAAVHRFADGTELTLGSDRGAQLAQLTSACGRPAAERWRDLLDHLDDVWQALRPLGSEYELTSADQIAASGLHRLVKPGRTIEQLARDIDHPQLAEIIRTVAWRAGSDPRRTPAWCAAQLSVERTFGRWMISHDGHPTRTGTLVDALATRLATRDVDVRTTTTATSVRPNRHTAWSVETTGGRIEAAAVIAAVNPWTYAELTGDRAGLRRLNPALAPQISHTVSEQPTDEPTETIAHTRTGPVISWTRPLPGQRTLTSTHDWTRAMPDRGAGIGWRGDKTWLRMPPVRTGRPRLYRAGPHNRGGHALWSVILTGALASYACHDDLFAPAGERSVPG